MTYAYQCECRTRCGKKLRIPVYVYREAAKKGAILDHTCALRERRRIKGRVFGPGIVLVETSRAATL
jgi:hypothetical protein